MNNRIWKYKVKLEPLSKFDLEVPKGATDLHVELMNGDLVFWFMVDTDETEKDTRHFSIEGTGQPLVVPYYDEDYMYHALYMETFFHGPFVWHLFEHWPDDEEDE